MRVRPARLLAGALTSMLALTLGVPAAQAAPAPSAPIADRLRLGDADLPETRTSTDLAPGVTLTQVVRGSGTAVPAEYETTTRGPWRVWALRIDPRRAKGQLVATDGPDIARTETVDVLNRYAGGLAAVNGSFFTFTADRQYPGDPVGLSVRAGELLSEPTTYDRESDLIFDAKQNRLRITRTSWTGTLTDRESGTRTPLEAINHPPAVDQTVRFTPEFAARTPEGAGLELVLNRDNCVVRSAPVRGTALAAGETSIQATGADVAALQQLATGCIDIASQLRDAAGEPIKLKPHTYAVNGRVELLRDGKDLTTPIPGDSFYARNPRTVAGTDANGVITLIVIDGRQPTSVGTTIPETAQVARDFGLTDALNLDGGGSSTMVARDQIVNQPSGTAPRPVGDALVWLPRRGN
ncbi:phosphodiester glycosidase family protein [Enemella evansiae]|nr:phosphodiester glycosidase family protein [Enemella evansiae]